MSDFAPRRPEEAARWLAALLLVALVLLLVGTPLTATITPLVLCVVVGSSVFCASMLLAIRNGWRPGAVAWLATMTASVVLILTTDLVTADVSAAGQLYFLLPAVASASQLRPRGAWLVTGICSVGELVLVLSLLEPTRALIDWASLSAFAAVFVSLLTRAADRQERLLADLQRQAAIDAVTGLLTRRVLDEALASALSSRGAPDGPAGTVLMIVDLDHFKAVNDVHGHPVGDAALTHVGRLLTTAAGPGAVVSRLGGDELAVLLPGSSPVGGERCGQRVVEAVRTEPLVLPGGGAVALTVSVGVAHSPTHAVGVEDLYRAADEALYVAKRGGRDRMAVAVGPGAGARGATAPAPQRATVPLTPTTVPPPTQT